MDYSTKDVIRSAYDQNPTEMEAALNSVMQDKIGSAIAARRDEIVGDMIPQDNGEE